MYIAQNKVRIHDTDMAGILYFPKLFRFAHDALEDFLLSFGVTYSHVLHEMGFIFVIVHVEADYLTALRVGDMLEIEVNVEKIGDTSFTMNYKIYKKDKILAGIAKTVHVTLDTLTREKISIPIAFRKLLEPHCSLK